MDSCAQTKTSKQVLLSRLFERRSTTYDSVHVCQEVLFEGVCSAVVVGWVDELPNHFGHLPFAGGESVPHHGSAPDKQQQERRAMEHARLQQQGHVLPS